MVTSNLHTEKYYSVMAFSPLRLWFIAMLSFALSTYGSRYAILFLSDSIEKKQLGQVVQQRRSTQQFPSFTNTEKIHALTQPVNLVRDMFVFDARKLI